MKRHWIPAYAGMTNERCDNTIIAKNNTQSKAKARQN